MTLPTIVYIEDDAPCAELVTAALKKRCRVLHASNGVAGLGLAERVHPALVLVDLHLPGLSGFEVMAKLRANPDTAAIPLLAISARVMGGEPVRAAAMGCRGFVKKPFRLDTLREAVDAALGNAPA